MFKIFITLSIFAISYCNAVPALQQSNELLDILMKSERVTGLCSRPGIDSRWANDYIVSTFKYSVLIFNLFNLLQ